MLDVNYNLSSEPEIAAVCVVKELTEIKVNGLLSGINKQPTLNPVKVKTHGIWGDIQGDREHHGGIFKAVYAFAKETRMRYQELENKELPDGFFGENLVTTGFNTDESVIGQRWQIGSSILEVSCHRSPCAAFAQRMNDRDWPARYLAGGKTGALLKVVQEGQIKARDKLIVLSTPEHAVTVGDVFRGLDANKAQLLLKWAIETNTVLYEAVVRHALLVLERADKEFAYPLKLRSDGRGDHGGPGSVTR